MPTGAAPRPGARSQLSSTFVRNHASAVLACDFFVAMTASFRVIYVFIVLEVGTRRIRHWNVTEHPTAELTAQQFRMVIAGDEPYRFLMHTQWRLHKTSRFLELNCSSRRGDPPEDILVQVDVECPENPIRSGHAFCQLLDNARLIHQSYDLWPLGTGVDQAHVH